MSRRRGRAGAAGVVVEVARRHEVAAAFLEDALEYHDFPRFPTPRPPSPAGSPRACGRPHPLRIERRRGAAPGGGRRRPHGDGRPCGRPSPAGGPVSRVLSGCARGRIRPIISLGRASPRASCGQPGDRGGPGKPFLPIGPCTGWGLPSCPCCHGHWCALTAPFHPYPGSEHPEVSSFGRAERPGRSALCCTCRRLTRPAVSWHPALRCPDFPRTPASPPSPAIGWPTLRGAS